MQSGTTARPMGKPTSIPTFELGIFVALDDCDVPIGEV